jgi:phosphoribosylanthranilate isomerase
VNVRVKVCGIIDNQGLAVALAAGVDAVGFNFHPASPRCITPQQAARLIQEVPETVATVGVFANRPLQEVDGCLEYCGLGWAQFHGDEHPAMLASFSRPWYPVVRPGEGETRMDADWQAPAVLVDARRKEALGGTGELADWSAAASLARRMKVILAGGLAPENLNQAMNEVRPWGVDLNSGVETAPGCKSRTLLAEALAVLAPWRTESEAGWL